MTQHGKETNPKNITPLKGNDSQLRHWLILLLGPMLLLFTLITPPPAMMPQPAWAMVGVAGMMAIWWIFEVVPIPVTSLLPIILLPLLGVADIKTVTAPYAHPIIALFFGGFMIGMAMERWDLHRRIALNIMAMTGSKPQNLIAGFMLATAFLSMWVSNTATSVMMLPIGLSVAGTMANQYSNSQSDPQAFTKALLLAIAYSASIGGLATLIGTPPNALLAAFLSETYQQDIGFAQWLFVGLPISVVMLFCAWLWLTHFGFNLRSGSAPNTDTLNEKPKGSGEQKLIVETIIKQQLNDLGSMSTGEKIVLIVFVLTAFCWMLRPWMQTYIHGISDPLIAIVAAVSLFIIPVRQPNGQRQFVMTWEKSKDVPWGIFILFGGGLALAAQIKATGLAEWIASHMMLLANVPTLVIVLTTVSVIVFLTELTSNTATAAGFLPLLGAMAVSLGIDPVLLAAPAAMAASCAFMMPVATPPNAIVFAAGKLEIVDMIRCGFLLNFVGILVISLLGYYLISSFLVS